jgi:putative sterol carrier protein
MTGKLNAQQAFLAQKLKVAGDMRFAMKLSQIIGNAAAKAKL